MHGIDLLHIHIFFLWTLRQIYIYQDIGPYMICGDFNARCSNEPDYIEGVDVVERHVVVQKSTAYTWLDCCCFNAAQIVLTPPAPRNGGPFLPFFGQAGQVDPLVGWRSCY